MKVMFIAGFGPIAPDVVASRLLYEDALGISFKGSSSTSKRRPASSKHAVSRF